MRSPRGKVDNGKVRARDRDKAAEGEGKALTLRIKLLSRRVKAFQADWGETFVA